MDNAAMIAAAKAGFDDKLHTEEYRRIHSDEVHLARLIEMMSPKPENRYLDIGTGNGYVAFALASIDSNIRVDGLDIAENSIYLNNKTVENNGLGNIAFSVYDGFRFPFLSHHFSGAVSRYAFHHFPEPSSSIKEISRVLEPEGLFLYSDPEPDPNDKEGFIDDFQKLIPDGHVHFYRAHEIIGIFKDAGFTVKQVAKSLIRYPREMNYAYEELFKQTPKEILDSYKTEVIQDKVFITVSVLNVLFKKGG